MEADPIIGNWYRRTDKDQTFTVLGLDEEEGIIEIQHLDGEVEEIDASSWQDMELEPIDEPEEWRPLGMNDEFEDDGGGLNDEGGSWPGDVWDDER